MSPVLAHAKLTRGEFEARAVADWKKVWRTVADPEGDPQPRVYLYRTEPAMMHAVDVPPEWFGYDGDRYELFGRISAMAAAGGCEFVGFANTTMMVDSSVMTDEEREETNRTGKFPERILAGHDNLTQLHADRPDIVREQSQVLTIDKDIATSWLAQVKRKRPQPPRLVGLERFEGVEGPMVDALQRGLREPEKVRGELKDWIARIGAAR